MPCFETKSSWRPPNDHLVLEIFLSKVEKDLCDVCKKQQTYSLTLTVRNGKPCGL